MLRAYNYILYYLVLGGHTQRCSGLTSGSALRGHSVLAVFGASHGVLGIEARSATCKASTLSAVLSSGPYFIKVNKISMKILSFVKS